MSERWQLKEATRIVKLGRYASRLLMAVIIGLALVGSLPARVQADDGNPVDLELRGKGATPWDITNIQPPDSSNKTVELRNVGSANGFVTIWVSDTISSEGINPESETGNTTEPGEFTDHLLFNLTADGLSSNLKLPITFNNLPQSVTWPDYVELIPLRAGDTIDLQWSWELPIEAGNDVQGDSISFTMNYLLQEFVITDVSDVVTENGTFTDNVTVESEGGNGELTISENTTGLTEEGDPVTEIWLLEIEKESSTPTATTATVGAHYDAGPSGTNFDQPVILVFTYDPADIPERAKEADLFITWWDENVDEWVELEGFIVDTESNTISVAVNHFSRYTIQAHVPPPPPPIPTPIGDEDDDIPPPPPPPPITTRLLEVDMLGKTGKVEIGADGTLSESLTLTDLSGNFIIDIDSGTKVTGADDMKLSRIDLTIAEEPIAVPDNMVVLSPLYEVTGYTQSMEVTRINFEPHVIITINYDPRDLPENVFSPFIANYTDEQGLVRLEPPPDAVFEIGKAKALIRHASLFTVMAEIAPPPPPLPAKFEVSSLTVYPKQAQLGQPVIISLAIANEGETTGSYELHLVIDGIVRAVKEITLDGKSIETVRFEVSNLAVGRHRVKIAGLTDQFRIISAVVLPTESKIDWFLIDLSIVAAVVAGSLGLYLFIRRSQRLQSSQYGQGQQGPTVIDEDEISNRLTEKWNRSS